MVKMEFHFFVLFLKRIRTKILASNVFQDFFNSAAFCHFSRLIIFYKT
jgi:hypothetical protein